MPGGLKLALGALVVRPIQPRVLNEDIKTVEERPRGRAAASIGLSGVRDSSLLFDRSVAIKTKRESDLMHDYGGNRMNGLSPQLRHQKDTSVGKPTALH